MFRFVMRITKNRRFEAESMIVFSLLSVFPPRLASGSRPVADQRSL